MAAMPPVLTNAATAALLAAVAPQTVLADAAAAALPARVAPPTVLAGRQVAAATLLASAALPIVLLADAFPLCRRTPCTGCAADHARRPFVGRRNLYTDCAAAREDRAMRA